MSKTKIFLWHGAALFVGSGLLVVYFIQKISALPPEAALAGIALIPVAIVFIAGFGMFCIASCIICMIVSHFRKRRGKAY